MIPDYRQAWALVRRYNHEPFHLRHSLTVAGVMKRLAQELGYADEQDFWGVVGLLHDVDFEQYPDQHCVKAREILEKEGYDERLIRAVVSHGYGLCSDVKPEHEMEKVLYAIDELTGLVSAVVRVRPTHTTRDLEVSSVLKKFKSPAFAAGCSREVIQKGADALNIPLEELIEKTIRAMRIDEQTINAYFIEFGEG